MERSFKAEVEKLKLGDGETFHGEAILAVTKALLQSGVAYVGGYQGAPVSHVMDVLNDARDILDGLGVHVETNANEAGGRGHARRVDQLPDARRGGLQVHRRHQRRFRRALQPRLRRRQGRHAARPRRGLRRGRLDHPGAHARLRHEVADVAARPAPQPAEDRRDGRAGLRAVGSLQHAGDARAAHPRLPRAGQLQDEEERGKPGSRRRTSSRRPISTTAASACRPPPTRRKSTRSTCAGRPQWLSSRKES